MDISEIFATFIITSCVGLILASMRLCYKSKCKTIDMCCIKITRDTEGEEKYDLEHIPSSDELENQKK